MTKLIKVSGVSMHQNEIKKTSVNVRMTKDAVGKTISFEDGERMIVVPFEAIEDAAKWLLE